MQHNFQNRPPDKYCFAKSESAHLTNLPLEQMLWKAAWNVPDGVDAPNSGQSSEVLLAHRGETLAVNRVLGLE